MRKQSSPNGPAGDIVRASKSLTADQQACLEALVSTGSDFLFLSFHGVAKRTGLTKKRVRVVVRQLARKGLAQYQNGLFNEDGEVAGSGYAATMAGRVVVEIL